MKNSSTLPEEPRKSPRVAAVLTRLVDGGISQRQLARDAGLNGGVVNQLTLNQTRSTAKLIGRLCAVLDRVDAAELLAAYLSDVSETVAEKQQEAIQQGCKPYGSVLKAAKFSVLFPPNQVGGG